MKLRLIPSACLIAVMIGAITTTVTGQVTIDRADIEAWVDVPVVMYSWDVNDNVSGSAMPDTTALTGIISGGVANFNSIVANLKRSVRTVMKRMPADVVGADSFPTATHVEQMSIMKPGGMGDSTIYRFSILTEGAMTHLGIAIDLVDTDQDGTKDTVIGRYLPSGWKDRELPAGVGRAWQSSHTQKMWVKAPVVGMFLVVGAAEEREYSITGTTTLTTPALTAPAIVLHVYEFITHPQGGVNIALERFSYITESGVAVTVSYKLDNKQSRRRTGINDIAYFVPEAISSVADRIDERMLEDARLGPNRPNPWTVSTNIPFSLERAGHVRLAVYDALGAEVAELVDAQMPVGEHTVEFPARDLPGGLYTYRLQVDDRIVGRTMILRK